MLLLYFLRSFSSVAVPRLSRFLTFTRLKWMLGAVVMGMSLQALALAPGPVAFSPTVTENSGVFKPAPVTGPSSRLTFGFTPSGMPKVTGPGFMSFGPGGVPVNVTGPVTMRSAAEAFGRFFARSLPLMATGFALYELCKELLYTCKSDGTITKQAPSFGTFDGYRYRPYRSNTDFKLFLSYDSLCRSQEMIDAVLLDNGDAGRTDIAVVLLTCAVDGATFNYTVPFRPSRVVGMNIAREPVSPSTCVVGSPVGANGLCVGSTESPATLQELEDAIAQKSGWPASSKVIPALKDALDSGESVEVAPDAVTGPTTEPGPATTKTNPDGSTEVTRTTNNYNYEGNKVTVTQTTTIINHNPATNTTTTTTVVVTPQLPPAPELKTCGYPGGPKCQIDETGTPNTATLDIGLPKIKADTDAYNDSVKSPADKGMFDQLKQFFDAPPLVQCQPFAMPSVMSIQIPPIDPCPVVDGVRDVMAFVWAFVGMFLGIGFIREAI